MDEGFSGKKAAEIVGISYRQLDYWTRTELIEPELASASGSGSRRRYSYRNLLELKLVKTMLDSGIKLESVREGFAYLRETLGQEVASARLVIADGAATLVTDDAQMVDVINRFHGQGVLNLIDLDGLKGQVDAAVLDLDTPSEVRTDLALAAEG